MKPYETMQLCSSKKKSDAHRSAPMSMKAKLLQTFLAVAASSLFARLIASGNTTFPTQPPHQALYHLTNLEPVPKITTRNCPNEKHANIIQQSFSYEFFASNLEFVQAASARNKMK